MAHRLLQQYPDLYGKLLFLNYNFILEDIKALIPVSDTNGVSLYRKIGEFYANAEDGDILFFRRGRLCTEPEQEESADACYFNTGLRTEAGNAIWLRAERNSRPEIKVWRFREFIGKMPWDYEIPVERAEGSHRFLEEYPKFDQFIHLNANILPTQLPPLISDGTVLDKWVYYNRIVSHYSTLRDEEIVSWKSNEHCADADADMLTLPTEFSTSAGIPILLVCIRNPMLSAIQPWMGRNLLPENALHNAQTISGHRYLRDYPTLFDSLLFADWNMLSYRIKPLTQTTQTPQEIYTAIGQHYMVAGDDEIQFFRNESPCEESEADSFVLNSGFKTTKGDEIYVAAIRNLKPGSQHRWWCNRVYTAADSFNGKSPSKWLYSWACMFKSASDKNMDAVIEELKEKAADEDWDYQGENSSFILRNYLQYTFVKLWNEGKVIVSENQKMAAFNTGLVNKLYDYIYAVFNEIPNVTNAQWHWKIAGFCTPGSRGLGKELLKNFNPLPAPAKYFDNSCSMIYELDFGKPIDSQVPSFAHEHILLERNHRLPVAFFRTQAYDNPELLGVLQEIEEASDDFERQKALWKDVSAILEDNAHLYMRYKDRLDDALKLTMKRVAWNYRTAIPYYSPSSNKNCLLLPLCLTSQIEPDVAMVVERFENKTYFGHTIITLNMAYNNSRLVSKPESDWLKPTNIQVAYTEEDET